MGLSRLQISLTTPVIQTFNSLYRISHQSWGVWALRGWLILHQTPSPIKTSTSCLQDTPHNHKQHSDYSARVAYGLVRTKKQAHQNISEVTI